ncbi:MAG: hypothetical protein ACR2GH_12890 [Pseudonocardia sp.]
MTSAQGLGLLPRRAEAALVAALADTRVVVVNGARQVGKSTLARLVADRCPQAEERRLDDPGRRAAGPGGLRASPRALAHRRGTART